MRAHLPLCLALVATGVVHPRLIPARADAANCIPILITAQPQSQSVLEGCPVTFSVEVTGTNPSYRWYHDEQLIADATNRSCTISHALLADNGARFHATIDNECSQVVSSEATLHILRDVVPPRLLRARGDASLERVVVTFAVGGCGGFPGLDPRTANDPYMYSMSGGIIVSNAQMEPNGTNVILTTTRQATNTLYTLRVEGIADQTGNIIPPGSEAMLQSWGIVEGAGTNAVPPPVSLLRSGTDIWIIWPYGSFLQSASDLAGPWLTLLNADFPYKVTVDGSAHFYRALFDP